MSDFSCDSRVRVNCESCPDTVADVLTHLKVEKFCVYQHPYSIMSHLNYDDNDCIYGFCFEGLREAIPTSVSKVNTVIYNLNIKIPNPVWGERTSKGYEIIINELQYDDNNTGMFVFYRGGKETPSQTEIVISGADKQLVGQVAAEIRDFRPPEPYKGKGIRYVDERVFRKEAKKK